MNIKCGKLIHAKNINMLEMIEVVSIVVLDKNIKNPIKIPTAPRV